MKVGCLKRYLHSIQAQVLIWPLRTSTYGKPVFTKSLEEQVGVTREQQSCLSKNGQEHGVSNRAGIIVPQREKPIPNSWLPAEKEERKAIYPLQNIKPEQTVKISSQTSQDNTELACMPCENHVILWLRHKPENLVHDLAIWLHFMWTSQAPELLSSIPPSTDPHYRYWGFLAQRNNNKKTLSFETQQHIISSLLFISHHHLPFKFQLGNTDPKVTSQKMCHWELQLCWPKPSTWELFSAAGKCQAIHTCSRFQTVDLLETNLFPLSALQKGVTLFLK